MVEFVPGTTYRLYAELSDKVCVFTVVCANEENPLLIGKYRRFLSRFLVEISSGLIVNCLYLQISIL